MLKSTLVLFVLGIALGLWLGFNPQAHEKVVQDWNGARAFFAKLETDFSNTVSTWTMPAKREAEVGQKTVAGISSKPFSIAWQQFVSAGGTFLESVQKIWLELMINLHLSKS